jgi:hypothetical protein
VVEFDVCDAGVGIPKTLRESDHSILTDHEALDRAIREGVTRDKALGQGNGLFGTYQVCALSMGEFYIHSGWANLSHERSGLHVYPETIPFVGSLVLARINFAEKGVLEHALKFGGKSAPYYDYVEKSYESLGDNEMRLQLVKEATSLGSRIAGIPVRTKILNLLSMSSGQVFTIDFEDVPLLSSSFADEVFGKLFVELGPIRFGQQIRFEKISPLVRGLIDRAIVQRSAESIRGR